MDQLAGSYRAVNRSYYAGDDALETYENLANRGLFEKETRVIDTHFTNSGSGVLDLGCGAGRTTIELANRGFDVTGVDLNEGMIDRARSLFPDLDFAVGDATQLEYDDESFDYVLFSFNGIDELFPEPARYAALTEIRRVLKPGGVFAFSSQNSLHHYFLRLRPLTPTTWRDLVEFWSGNLTRHRMLSNYKYVQHKFGGAETYFISPLSQKRQLIDCGFTPLSPVNDPDRRSVYTDPWPYYVATSTE